MEATEVNRIGSMRRNSSIWRRGNESIFSASSREEDDEEALKWAALEKLPTFDRLRRGILSLPEGSQRLQEVDVQQLGFRERKALLERLVRVTDEDNERFLLKLKDRVDRWGHDPIHLQLLLQFPCLALTSCFYFGVFVWLCSIVELGSICPPLKCGSSTSTSKQRPTSAAEDCLPFSIPLLTRWRYSPPLLSRFELSKGQTKIMLIYYNEKWNRASRITCIYYRVGRGLCPSFMMSVESSNLAGRRLPFPLWTT